MRKRVLAITLISATLLGGCTSYKPVAPAFHAVLNEPYRLDSGDRVRMTVFEQESLTNTYAVDKAGYLSIPLIGDVPARGRTTEQLEG
ncbi:MAG TPA: polysaccharide biosynthesis/export family protein, partial [Paracoccaceae bacterium]|nr:polysaccharide biosynthesis/export family protein [Paracoccaceae bacterium]